MPYKRHRVGNKIVELPSDWKDDQVIEYLTNNVPQEESPPAKIGASQASALGVGQGIFGEWKDEADAGMSAGISALPWIGKPISDALYPGLAKGEGYTEKRDLARDIYGRAEQDNPVAYGVSNLAGAIGTGMLGGGAAAAGRTASKALAPLIGTGMAEGYAIGHRAERERRPGASRP